MSKAEVAPIVFKCQIKDGVIKIPKEYLDIQNAFVSVKIKIEKEDRRDENKRVEDNIVSLDFSECMIDCFKGVNPIDFQRKIRDEK